MLSHFTTNVMYSMLPKPSMAGLLAFANTAALNQLKSFESFSAIYSKVETFSNALSFAIHVWDHIPPAGRTGVLFITGRFIHAIPFVNGLKYTEEYLVDADKDVRSTHLIDALDKTKLLLKAMSNPLTATFQVGKYMYSRFWGGTPAAAPAPAPATDHTEASPALPAPEQAGSKLMDLDLKLIHIKVDGIHLEKGDESKNTKGGLHADFHLGNGLVDRKLPVPNEGKISLVLPFSGGFSLASAGAVTITNGFNLGEGALEAGRLSMDQLEVDEHGLRDLKYSLHGLGLGRGFFKVDELSGEFHQGGGAKFAAKQGEINWLGWKVKADLGLELDEAGKFKQASISKFDKTNKYVTFNEAVVTKTGLMVDEVVFPSLGGNLVPGISGNIKNLQIDATKITGEGEITAKDVRLIGDAVVLEDITGKVIHGESGLSFKDAQAALHVSVGGIEKADGTFAVAYDSQTKSTTFALKDGEVKAGYGGFAIHVTGISYSHDERQLRAALAKLTVPSASGDSLEKPALEGEFKDWTFGAGGVTGEAEVRASDVTLFGGKLAARNIKGNANFKPDGVVAWAGADLAASTRLFQAKGRFRIGYDSQAKHPEVALENGEVKAHYGGFALDASGISYHSEQKELRAQSARLTASSGAANSLDAPALEADFKNWSIGDKGVAGEGQVRAKDIKLFGDALTVTDIKGTVDLKPAGIVIEAGAELAASKGAVKAAGHFAIGYDSASHETKVALQNGSLKADFGMLQISATNMAYDRTGKAFTVDEATVGVGKGAAHDKGKVAGIDFGMLDFLPLNFTGTAYKISYSAAGLTVGSFKPKIGAISFKAFGFDGSINPEEMEARLQAKRSLELHDIAPMVPTSAGISVPLLPAFSVSASIEPIARLDLDLDLSAKGTEGTWKFAGTTTLGGELGIKARLEAELGHSLIAALAVGGFVQGSAKANAKATSSGERTYDREKKFQPKGDFKIEYAAEAAISVAVGVALRAKAFYFFNKTLYEYTAKEWQIGRSHISGSLFDKDGKLAPGEYKREFVKGQAMDAQTMKDGAANKVLMSGEEIPGSQQEREDMLMARKEELMASLTTMTQQIKSTNKTIKRATEHYVKVIKMKEALSRVGGEQAIAGFNEKYKVAGLQEQFAEHVAALEKLQAAAASYEKSLTEIELKDLERGVKAQVTTLDSTRTWVQQTHVPETGQLLVKAEEMGAHLNHDLATLTARLGGVMVPAVFIAKTTTSTWGVETTRKNIVPVDDALQAYHAAPSREAGAELLRQVGIYLAENKGGRVEGVKQLLTQVQEALKQPS
jgi:hypothetical protein